MEHMSNAVNSRAPSLLKYLCAFTCTAAVAVACLPSPTAGADGPLYRLNMASQLLRDRFAEVQRRSGIAAALEERIDGDIGQSYGGSHPPWMTDQMYAQYLQDNAFLDASLVEQLATGRYHDVGSVRGMDDVLVRSPADGSMQPAALFVPSDYRPDHPTPLVVFLHGRTWTENDVLATQPVVRDAASRNGAILVAPLARGDNDYVAPAPVDVYAALAAVEQAFTVDCNRVYLAGHSMGGYGVFVVGTIHPEKWAGIFAASGAMNKNIERAALTSLKSVPMYVVWGTDDEYAPPGYFNQVVAELNGSGIDAQGYEERSGRHAIVTIRQSFDRAWDAMLRRQRLSRRGC